MHYLSRLSKRFRRLLLVSGMTTALLLSFWLVVGAQSTPLAPFGYLDYSYSDGWTGASSPTGEKPESKLWWNDGFWWGSLFNPADDKFHIYRLNWGTQTWEDTGVIIDDRPNTKADTLWDGTKLYVASHVAVESDGEETTTPINWARLYRFSYDAAQQKYTLDAGFPTNINRDRTETLVLAKGASGRLWATYISRGTTANPNRDYRIFVNSSADGTSWGTAFVPTLNVTDTAVHVGRGDVAAVVAFGNNIGLMWNSTLDDDNHTLHFAHRADSNSTANDPWTHQMISVPGGADDHISLRTLTANASGQVFAAIKTSTPLTDPLTQTVALVGLVARDVDGTISFHMYSRNTDKDTQPSLVLDEGDVATAADDKAYIFVSGKEGGSKICYKSLAIKSPLASMGNFPVGDCGTSFIEDLTYKYINRPTSMKQNANKTTGIVVLASDDFTAYTTTNVTRVYMHNVMGNPPPVVTAKGPSVNPVQLTTVVTATFSKPIAPATLNASNFILESPSGVVTGTISYAAGTRTATFLPSSELAANTTYTVKLTNGIKDTSGLGLNEGIDAGPVVEQWTFSTGAAGVQFQAASYTVNEIEGTATITVVLDTPSAQAVSVNYATSNGTATTSDYTASSGTLTFNPGETAKSFTVPILDDNSPETIETVNLTLSNPVNAALGVLTTATLSIIDNESTTVQVETPSYTLNETGGQVAIQVTLSSPAAFSITVNYATSDGTAVAGSDYTAASGTLTFAPGETSQPIIIAITNDNAFESSEAFNLTLSNITPNTTPFGVPNSASITILDDDQQPTVKFSSTTYSANEGASTANITVTLSTVANGPVTIDYATSAGTASASEDFTTTVGTLTFAAGETSKVLTVPVVNDILDEEEEVFDVQLSNPNGALLGAPFSALITIVDEDAAPTVQFENANITKNESIGVVDIVVTLSAPSGKLVTVNYASGNGSAIDGEDYASAIGTLTFAPGETSQAFELSVLNDKTAENTETLTLTLSNPTNATLGATTSTTVGIIDNDSGTTPTSSKIYLPLVRK